MLTIVHASSCIIYVCLDFITCPQTIPGHNFENSFSVCSLRFGKFKFVAYFLCPVYTTCNYKKFIGNMRHAENLQKNRSGGSVSRLSTRHAVNSFSHSPGNSCSLEFSERAFAAASSGTRFEIYTDAVGQVHMYMVNYSHNSSKVAFFTLAIHVRRVFTKGKF